MRCLYTKIDIQNNKKQLLTQYAGIAYTVENDKPFETDFIYLVIYLFIYSRVVYKIQNV